MNNIAISINSCYKFHKKTIESIINSSKKANIPSKNIYIIVGESDDETDIIFNGDYNIVYCKYVNEAYNSAIYFTQNERGIEEIKKYTHIFYTQDTTDFLENFWDNIQIISNNCDDYIKLEPIYSKNIGLFNVKWLIENKTELLSYYINYDKELIRDIKGANLKNKDLIYKKFNNLAQWLNEDCLFMFNGNGGEPLGKFFINQDKPMFFIKKYSDEYRLATVYNNPGIIKYQKNYGKGGEWDLNL